jgi:ubiquitin-protein ligase
MATGRLRRLQNEYREMEQLRDKSSLLRFTTQGNPPTRYEVQVSCRGLARYGNAVTYVEHHEFDIVLESEFPLLPPTIVWKTPIYHPNFRRSSVCLGDYWYAGSSIAELCVALCEMVQYKTFNIYDPLDNDAAIWLHNELREGPDRFPIDTRPVRDLDFDLSIRNAPEPDAPEPVAPEASG